MKRHLQFALLGLVAFLDISPLDAQSSAAPELAVRRVDTRQVQLTWPASAAGFELETTDNLAGVPTWRAVGSVPQIQNIRWTVTVPTVDAVRFYRLRQVRVGPAFQIARHTPLDGANDVGVTFRPQVFFSQPIHVATLSSNNFFATAGGTKLEANIVPANDGSFAWLFFKQPAPGGTRVRVSVDGATILSADGATTLDADGDGQPGGVLQFEFTTVSRVALPGTSLSGIVADPGPDLKPRTFDDFAVGPDEMFGTDDDVWSLPIAGVRVFLLGREDQVIVTGADGRFHFDAVPVGNVKVVVDGTTALNPPAGMYFPEMVLDVDMKAGSDNWTMTDDPAVYLPRLFKTILQSVDVSTNTVIGTKPEGAAGLTDAQRQQLTVEVPANSLIGADGTRLTSGQIGISTVPPELVRDMLPPGVLQHTFDVTVQAPGIATFSTPAPMSFPNVFDAPPGTQLNFLSFDHTTGRLVIEGTATVSNDGQSVRTDPGTGITHPGWHGLTPPGGPSGPGPDSPPAVCAIDLGTGNASPAAAAAGRSLQPSSLAGSITLNVPRALPMIVGETGDLKDPFLTWAAPAADGEICGLKVQIEVDGPLDKFMKKTGNLALKSQTFTLRPFALQTGPPKLKVLSGVAKTYDEVFGKGKFTNFVSDELLGARIKVTASLLKSTGPPDVTVDTYYLYRWVNVNFPAGFLGGPDAVAANATAAFRKTLNDGIGGWSTIKQVVTDLPTNSPTHFSIALPPLSPKTFDVSSPLKNRQFQWEFDPHKGITFEQEMSIQVDDGYDTEVGKLTLYGNGIDPARVNLNLDGYKAELKRVILSLRNVTSRPPLPFPGLVFPVYEFSANAPGLPPVVITGQVSGPGGVLFPEHKLNYVPGGATNVSDGPDLRLGTKDDVRYNRWILGSRFFQQSFPGFMPANRHLIGADQILGSPDDAFDFVQLATLDSLINAEAAELADQVAQQFQRVNFFTSAIQFVDTGGDITCEWTDCFVTLGDGRGYGPASPGKPVFGLGGVGGRDKDTLLRLLPHPKLPLGAKYWALAGGLYFESINQISVSVAMHINYASQDTFAAYVANSVSHEIGHTLGLLDAYTNDGKVGTALCVFTNGNCAPNDIMRSGQSTDPYLQFAPGNIGLLKAAVGVSSVGPLPLAKQEVPLLAELRQYRKTFNLATSSTGIRENNPLDPPPTAPEISVFQEDNSFFGEADEALKIAGEIAADGPSGDFIDVPFTILNSGYGPLTVSSLAFAAGSKGFTLVNANTILGQPITPGGSTNLVVRFDPSVGGGASDTLQIGSDASAVPLLRIPITATAYGSAPSARVELAGNNNFGGAIPGTAAIALPEIFRVSNAGQTPLHITSIAFLQGAGSFTLTGLPANLASQPIQLAHGQSFTFGGSFQPEQTGLRRAVIEIKTNDPQTPIVRVSFVGTGLGVPMEAQWGDDFVAIESPDFPETPPLRVKSDDKGNFEFFLPPQQFYHLGIFDPVTGLVGHETDTTASSGQRTLLVDTMVFQGSTEPDSDYDGLPDDIEFTIGTNPNKADTDGEGVDDFAAISQGLDPFGGRSLPLGIVGQLAIAGEAKEIIVLPPAGNGDNPVAVVAAGTGGLAMIDVGNPTQPILLNQLSLPGDATDVAVDFELRIAAVAANDGGLHLVDVADPASPKLFNTCFAKAEHVEVVNGVAYFVSGGLLRAVDLLSRELLPSLASSLGSVLGMTREGTMLYFTDPGSNLRLVDVSGRTMKLRGQLLVGAPFVNSPIRQPVVGNRIAYLTLSDITAGGGGYATVDVSNPDALKVIHGTDVPPPVPPFEYVPGKGMALNGSGVGLLIGWLLRDPNYFNRLNVMNVSDPSSTYVRVTSFNLPTFPQSITIADHVAYVACGPAGLVMVNYLNFDAQGVPPTVALSAGGADGDPNRPGVQVVEGTLIPIYATVRDDVQAGNVELLVNGQVVQTAISFPFNLEAVAPSAAENGGRFTVQVRATDSGGNVGVSDPLVIEAVPDSRAFAMESLDPADGHIVPTDNGVIEVTFTKPVHPRVVTAENFFVVNSRGQAIRPSGFDLIDAGRSVRMRLATLPSDGYTLVLRSAAIRDYSGNALAAADLTSRFTTRVFTIRWTGVGGRAGDGVGGLRNFYSWRNPTNWFPVRVPGPEDSVYVNVPRTNIVIVWAPVQGDVLPNGDPLPNNGVPLPVKLASLVSNEEIALNYIDLHVEEFIQINNSFSLSASHLRESLLLGRETVLRNFSHIPGGLTDQGFAALLDGVTLKGDFQLYGSFFHVRNKLTLEGNLYGILNPGINATSTLGITRDTVFQGPGTFHDINLFLNPVALATDDVNQPGPVVMLNSNVTFRGHFRVDMEGVEPKLVNRGKLLLDQPTPTDLSIGATAPGASYSQLNMVNIRGIQLAQPFINEGTIEISNGYRFEITGTPGNSLVNRGVLRVRDLSRLRIMSPFVSPKTICDADSICYLGSARTALITDPGQVSELSGAGRWFISKEFRGGTVRLTDGAVLEGDVTFNDVTFEGELHNYDWNKRVVELPELRGIGYGFEIVVRTNLTLNGLIQFHRKPGELNGNIQFFGGIQRLDGQGRIEHSGTGFGNQLAQRDGRFFPMNSLRIGSGITIHGANLDIGAIDTPQFLENFGTILANQPGDQLRFRTFAFTNSGTLHLGTNNVVNIGGNFGGKFSQTASGKLQFDVAGTIAGTTHGQIQMPTRTAALDGTLSLSLVPPFQPKAGDVFELLTWQSSSGVFSAIQGTPSVSGVQFTPEYQAQSFRLRVTP